MMNFRHVEIFHAVYTNGSVSAAARALNVAQPTVSKVLRHAESLAGFTLFHRSGGRLVATDEAHALFREASDIHERMMSLRQTTKNIGRRANGLIRFAVLPGFGLQVAPLAVAAFRKTHPAVTFDIRIRHTADFLRALQEKECDIVIGYEQPTHPKLAHHSIGEGELVLLYRRGDIPDAGGRLTLDVTERHDFVTIAEDSGPLGRLLSQAFERRQVAPREIISINTSFIAASLVRCGLGVAIVDNITALALKNDDLAFRGFDPPLRFDMCSVTLADRPQSKPVERFVRTLRQTVEAVTATPGDA